MKKLLKLSLIVALCTCVLMSFTGCGKNKNTITADAFKSTLEGKNFYVQDSTQEYFGRNEIVKSYLATAKTYNYQIEFFEFDSVPSAKSFFNNREKILEEEQALSMVKSNTKVSMANYSKRVSEFDGKYRVLSRVENTLIIVSANSTYKDEINSILNEFGY